MMRYISAISDDDGKYALILNECDKPAVGAQDVLIKTYAAGVNRADIYQAEGRYYPPEGVSDILGLEVAGEVMEIGAEVKTHAVGDKVCALLQGGGYAEYVAAPEWRVLPVPSGLDVVQAASLPEAVFTVYLNLFELARLQPGEAVLIHGGASGIGTIAIQIAKAFGAKAFVTAGSKEKCQLCKELGADIAINYKQNDFVEAVKRQGGADVVLDMVGGSYFQKNMQVLNCHGRMVSIAFIEGAKVEVNMAPLLLKNLTCMGSTLRSQEEEKIYDLAQSLRNTVWPLIESGNIKPVIDSIYPLEQAGEAHIRMQKFQHAGKMVLEFV